jgi:hypothetical protein
VPAPDNRCLMWSRICRWRVATCWVTAFVIFYPQVAISADQMQTPPVSASTSPFELPPWPGLITGPTWRIGGYLGALSHQGFINIILVHPFQTTLEPDYLADMHAVYTAYRFVSLPLDIEIEGGFAQRFGQNRQSEFDLIPISRWKWFPWNNLIYTNFRLGLLGASYVTGISQWEIQNSHNNKGSRYLNFLVPEFTFSSSPDSSWEAFIRVHHRSGIFGLIDGVQGGSNYLSVGARFVIQ